MRIQDISDVDFGRLMWYARYLKFGAEDFMNIHNIDVGELRFTEDKLTKMKEGNKELGVDEKDILKAIEFVKKNEIKTIECDKINQRAAEELERNHPTKFDEDGYAYREFNDYETGKLYREYIEMGN